MSPWVCILSFQGSSLIIPDMQEKEMKESGNEEWLFSIMSTICLLHAIGVLLLLLLPALHLAGEYERKKNTILQNFFIVMDSTYNNFRVCMISYQVFVSFLGTLGGTFPCVIRSVFFPGTER